MFTGIIQGLGYLEPLDRYNLRVQCQPASAALILPDIAIGDSIAVDGVCLTVETIEPQGFTLSVSPETLNRTILNQKLNGPVVNLESSLRVGGKIGGHFVTGHVDGIGHLISATESATSWELRFAIDAALRPFILPKGSIAINGISLTIANSDPQGRWITTAVIPHTYATTNLSHLTSHAPVNLEADILGKYVQRLLQFPSPASPLSPPTSPPETITLDFLSDQGYL